MNKTHNKPLFDYQTLMEVVRRRFDVIKILRDTELDNYDQAEIAAFHGRKIIESIAFGCLIGTENGLKHIPKNSKGQYNAEKILNSLEKRKITTFPSPSEISEASEQDRKTYNVTVMVKGIPNRRITKTELIKKYQRLHNWLHELNPYTKDGQDLFHTKHKEQLWVDLRELELFLSAHMISIKGEGFFCVLWDTVDDKTKVIPLSKTGEL